jgi:hypothetical protein
MVQQMLAGSEALCVLKVDAKEALHETVEQARPAGMDAGWL